MRILVTAPLAPQTQPTNAVPLVTHALLTALAGRHQVTLVTATEFGQADTAALEAWRARGVAVHVVRRALPPGLARWQRRGRLANMWLRQRWPWRTAWYWEPGIQRRLSQLLAAQTFDVISVEDNAAAVYDYGGAIPTILTEMEVRSTMPGTDCVAPRLSLAGQLAARDARRWRSFQPAAWRRFDRIQVLTRRDAQALCDIAPELRPRVRVNPFGIELPECVSSDAEQANHIVLSGGFTHAPNVDAAVWLSREILPLVQARCPNVHLTLVGSYPPPAVRSLASRAVTVTGTVPAVEPFLRRAAVVAAPVRLGGGQRMKVLQGMAHGKPVVTTTLGAEGLVLDGQRPPLRIANDSASIATALVELLGSAALRRELGVCARAYVAEYYSPAAYAGRLEQLYGELLDTKIQRQVHP